MLAPSRAGCGSAHLLVLAPAMNMCLSHFSFFFKVILSLAALGLCCCMGFSLVTTNGNRFLVMVYWLLFAVVTYCRARAPGSGLQ